VNTRYRFLYRVHGYYYWESVLPLPGDSRHVQYSCPVDWFWGKRGRT
jgi:hypothetical protein